MVSTGFVKEIIREKGGVINVINKQVECKVITPIISKGIQFTEDPRFRYKIYDFELRPQSVKGVLHFWFRAVAPRVIDIYSLKFDNIPNKEQRRQLEKLYDKEKCKGLKYLESMIFGSQNEKAPFGLIVDYDKSFTGPIGRFEYDKSGKLKFTVNTTNRESNFQYALYGTYLLTRDKKDESFVSSWLKPGQTFKLRFFLRNEQVWNVVYSLLKLVCVLSGFGAKITKGFGQFEVINDKSFMRSQYTNSSQINNLLDQVASAIKQFIEAFDKQKLIKLGKSQIQELAFPNLLDNSFVFLGPIVRSGSWEGVMNELYKQSRNAPGWYKQLKKDLRNLNQQKSKMPDAVKNLIECLNEREKQVEISPAIMGMPLQYQRLKAKINKITFYPYVPGESNNRGRKPSPLRIIINRNSQGWAAYGLLLKSKLTNEEKLVYDFSGKFDAKLTTTFGQLTEKIKENIEKGGRRH